MRRYRRLLALPAAILAMATLATAALAGPPERFVHQVDDRFEIPASACGFPIAIHAQGTVRETLFFDADGRWTRALSVFADFKVSFTNLLTGASVWTVQSATQRLVLNDDGSAWLYLTGLHGRVADPDGGFVADIGRLVVFLSADGPDEVVDFAGRTDGQGGPFPELCDALAA